MVKKLDQLAKVSKTGLKGSKYRFCGHLFLYKCTSIKAYRFIRCTIPLISKLVFLLNAKFLKYDLFGIIRAKQKNK